MLGNFQRSELRIEVPAAAKAIRDRLISPKDLSKWLFPQQLSFASNDALATGTKFQSALGPVIVEQVVDYIDDCCLRLRLSQGIDGYQEWSWGDGWVQSRLEGISLLPLNLYQTANLFRLQQALKIVDS
jgi:hypothetical protein